VNLRVTQVSPKGKRLKKDKGINVPDLDLTLSPLTERDLRDLDFVVEHADIVSYSFVQRPEDIDLLQSELTTRLKGKALLPLVLKIETRLAVANLPHLIVHAAAKQPLAVMIARGDLAVELGFERLAEMQEEILWLCEAAHVPVIWATQVLESLAKKGIPSRAEVTDAAMAERAECVMLNKGPYIIEAVTLLDNVLKRMQEHQTKKTAQLRALKSWVK
jgi:pyruvate kinase